jgi:DNA (cytosine-5)-methyltransferase 1
LLPPEEGGTPQHRERVFILAELRGKRHPTEFANLEIPNSPVDGWSTEKWAVDEFLDPDSTIANIERYRLSSDDLAALNAWDEFIKGIPDDALPGFPVWVDAFQEKPAIPDDAPDWKIDFITKNSAFYLKNRSFIDNWMSRSWDSEREFKITDFTASRRKFEWQARSSQPTASSRDLWKLAIQFRPSGIRVKPLTYLPTLVAITQTSFIGPRRRFLTPAETAAIQGFPRQIFANAEIDDKHAYKQVGNAVHVGVATYLAKRLFKSTGAPWLSE